MKLLTEVEKILDSYDLTVKIPKKYSNIYEYEKKKPTLVGKKFSHPVLNDSELIKKYRSHIIPGHYGFSIGSPTPKNWWEVIDKIIEFLIKNDPDFGIAQIKTKWGGIRFYIESEKIEDIFDIEDLIESKLHSEHLIF